MREVRSLSCAGLLAVYKDSHWYGQMAWLKPVIPALGSQKQNDQKHRARFDSTESIENDVDTTKRHSVCLLFLQGCVLSSERFFPLQWVPSAHTHTHTAVL